MIAMFLMPAVATGKDKIEMTVSQKQLYSSPKPIAVVIRFHPYPLIHPTPHHPYHLHA